MAKRKAIQAKKPTTETNSPPNTFVDASFFPFARYTSIVGVHTSLLLFTALFLPRSTMIFDITRPQIDLDQVTSRDRPQHPFLEDLTISPASTLACICAGAIVLQAWWGGWVRLWWIDYSMKGVEENQKIEKVKLQKLQLLLSGRAWLFVLMVSLVIHGTIVLLGAPLTSYVLRTYLLAFLLSVLAIFPPAYTLGLPSLSSDTESLLIRLTWIRLFAEFKIRTPIERALVYPAVGAILGCWFGAIPIALDWDRPWQAWPLTPTFGALLGYIFGSLSALTVSGTLTLADEYQRNQKAA